MPQIEWIKIHIDTFTGETFRRIRRVRPQGELSRDRLTAIFFELLVLAGRCNQTGQLRRTNGEPYATAEDIAIMLDRETEEVEAAMAWFMQDGCLTYADGVYIVTNWQSYQNEEALSKIREKNREKQERCRTKKKKELLTEQEGDCHLICGDTKVTSGNAEVTGGYSSYSPSVSESKSKSVSVSDSDTNVTYTFGEYGWVVLTERQYNRLLADLGSEELQRCIDYIDCQAQSTGNRNGWKDWNLVVRRCHREGWGPKSTDQSEADNVFLSMSMEVQA